MSSSAQWNIFAGYHTDILSVTINHDLIQQYQPLQNMPNEDKNNKKPIKVWVLMTKFEKWEEQKCRILYQSSGVTEPRTASRLFSNQRITADGESLSL
ncbi:hypothetical protein K6D80_000763 [Escherichia coli]|nr:hypothetical protein [Escherichia coli]EHZ5789635.1 hypothetical protein [Escherichia coli]EIB3249840.1 hypothetical protein [Escherichia coli]EID8111359.1 hypothetical protein [Escherichia coli]EIS3384248.1 hypothetical protein [Escherichia coli]